MVALCCAGDMDAEKTLIQLLRELQQARGVDEQCERADDLVVRVRPALYAYLVVRCDPGDVEDLLQEILIASARGFSTMTASDDKQIWGFCYKIARRKLVDHWRARERERAISTAPEELWHLIENTSVEDPITPDERLKLQDALELLRKSEELCYSYLWCYYILDWDIQDVARFHGVSPGAARMRITRCLEKARGVVRKGGPIHD